MVVHRIDRETSGVLLLSRTPEADRRVKVQFEARKDVTKRYVAISWGRVDWRERLIHAPYIPSLAYRLAMVAGGALDATFVKPNAHDWDIAAADLILREAGGDLVTQAGQAPSYGGETIRHGALAAGSGDLFTAMADVIANVP